MGSDKPDGSTYTPEEVEQTTRALLRLYTSLFEAAPRYTRIRVVLDWHAQVAAPLGVRAGAWREGPVTFGSYSGVPAQTIHRLVRRTFRRANMALHALYQEPDEELRLTQMVQVSAYVHARLIRIHPFEDGNGRLTRLLLTGMFLGADMDPPNLEKLERSDYLAALNRYNHAGTDRLDCPALLPLVKLLWRLLD